MPTRVGVLLVHGIGEQRRFEHLEGEVRHIAAALKADDRVRSTRVVIHTSPTAAFAAEHPTWRAEDVAPVMIEVTRDGGQVTEIHFREVWWADLDEPATLWTQIKFWSWRLSMWSLRGHLKSDYGKWMCAPHDTIDQARPKVSWWGRVRLFVVGMSFLLILLTVSLANLVLRRFPTLDVPRPDILVDDIGDLKLFQQKKRIGKGPLLDIGQPPRVTLRRRMVGVLVYMAMESDHRWYLLAHRPGHGARLQRPHGDPAGTTQRPRPAALARLRVGYRREIERAPDLGRALQDDAAPPRLAATGGRDRPPGAVRQAQGGHDLWLAAREVRGLATGRRTVEPGRGGVPGRVRMEQRLRRHRSRRRSAEEL